MAVEDDDMVVRSRHYLVTEAEMNHEASAQEVSDYLRRKRVTGESRVNHREGGVRQMTVTQKTPLTEKEWESVKQVIDME